MSAMARALSDGWSSTWPMAETPLSVRAARFQDTCSRGAHPAEHLPRLCQHLSTTGTSSGRHDAHISQSRRAQVATTARVSLRAHVCKQRKPAAVDVASCTLQRTLHLCEVVSIVGGYTVGSHQGCMQIALNSLAPRIALHALHGICGLASATQPATMSAWRLHKWCRDGCTGGRRGTAFPSMTAHRIRS